MSIIAFAPPFERAAIVATAFTLSVPATGSNGTAVPVTVTPNGTLASAVNVVLAVAGGGTLALSGFNFPAGSSAAQSTTLTRTTDGTSTVTMSNDGGLGNNGTPSSFVSGSPIPSQNARIAIWGQSNALGIAPRADISTTPLSSDAGLAAYDAGTFARVYIWNPGAGAYQQLQPGTNNAASASTTFGPEFGIAVRWMRETTTGNLYIEKEATGGASITNWETFLYDDMVTRHTAATSWLSSNSVTVTTNAFLWVQGEADASQTQAWYQTKMQSLIDRRVTDGCMGASDVSLLGQIPSGTLGYGAGVTAAKAAIAAATPATVKELPYSTYFLGDNLHMNARGQVQFGYDFMEMLFGIAHIST